MKRATSFALSFFEPELARIVRPHGSQVDADGASGCPDVVEDSVTQYEAFGCHVALAQSRSSAFGGLALWGEPARGCRRAVGAAESIDAAWTGVTEGTSLVPLRRDRRCGGVGRIWRRQALPPKRPVVTLPDREAAFRAPCPGTRARSNDDEQHARLPNGLANVVTGNHPG